MHTRTDTVKENDGMTRKKDWKLIISMWARNILCQEERGQWNDWILKTEYFSVLDNKKEDDEITRKKDSRLIISECARSGGWQERGRWNDPGGTTRTRTFKVGF